MPRSLRSSVKRVRTERQHNLQSIKNLVPILSPNHQQTNKTLCKREFLAILQLMPIKYADKVNPQNGLNSKINLSWCDTLERHLLERDINTSADIRDEQYKYAATSQKREKVQRKVYDLIAEKRQLAIRLESCVQENARLKAEIKYLEYMTALLLLNK